MPVHVAKNWFMIRVCIVTLVEINTQPITTHVIKFNYNKFVENLQRKSVTIKVFFLHKLAMK